MIFTRIVKQFARDDARLLLHVLRDHAGLSFHLGFILTKIQFHLRSFEEKNLLKALIKN